MALVDAVGRQSVDAVAAASATTAPAAPTAGASATPGALPAHRGRPLARRSCAPGATSSVTAASSVPGDGPVIMAANHVGLLDGPLLAICAPRPVHALTKLEMFAGPHGRVPAAAGQIPLERYHVDLRAIRTAVRVLRAGAASASSPRAPAAPGEMTWPRAGAAYLALVTGAPVVPVVLPRDPGAGRPRRLDPAAGHPARDELRRTRPPRAAALAAHPAGRWPTRRRGHRCDVLRTDASTAEQRTGMSLPGPARPQA